jgi:hypothetical protein
MKIVDVVSCRVQAFETAKVLFKGSYKQCIAFIKSYDKQSPTYLDLRIYDSLGNEKDYHALDGLQK